MSGSRTLNNSFIQIPFRGFANELYNCKISLSMTQSGIVEYEALSIYNSMNLISDKFMIKTKFKFLINKISHRSKPKT